MAVYNQKMEAGGGLWVGVGCVSVCVGGGGDLSKNRTGISHG